MEEDICKQYIGDINIQNILKNKTKHLLQPNNNKYIILKQFKNWNRHYSKDIQMANKYVAQPSLINWEMQIKTTRTYLSPHAQQDDHYQKRQRMTGTGEGMDKLEHLCTIGGKTKRCSDDGKRIEVPYKVKNGTIKWSRNLTLGCISKRKENRIFKICLHMHVHSSIFTIAKMCKQPRWPSTDEWVNK